MEVQVRSYPTHKTQPDLRFHWKKGRKRAMSCFETPLNFTMGKLRFACFEQNDDYKLVLEAICPHKKAQRVLTCAV